jgi:polysaccharide biosynthesis/export protein
MQPFFPIFAQSAMRRASVISLAVAVMSLAACAGQMRFPVTKDQQAGLAEQNINLIHVTTDNIALHRDPTFIANKNGHGNPPRDPQPYVYRIGPGDELLVTVWSDPERVQPLNSAAGSAERGLVVNEAGEIFYPFVGALSVSGRSAQQVRNELSDALRNFIADPQVEVAVSSFNAHQATVTGVVDAPGPTTLTNIPKRLLDLVNTAGITEESDLGRVILRRRGATHLVNLRAFLEAGESGQNPIILPGDVIQVPRMQDNKVFTFGEIATQEIRLKTDTSTSLTEVLAQVGGIDRIRADSRGIFVFRRTAQTPFGFDVFQFNLQMASTLVLATDFKLAPLDIVFVTNDPVTRWNDTVTAVVPPFTGLMQLQRAANNL